MTIKLLIARHGNTFGPGDIVTRVGTTDLPLVESGLQQGRNLGTYLQKEFADKIVLVVTSNGIARFSPYLTGNFDAFIAEHNIKISTGALCIFENSSAETWRCLKWNVKPTHG